MFCLRKTFFSKFPGHHRLLWFSSSFLTVLSFASACSFLSTQPLHGWTFRVSFLLLFFRVELISLSSLKMPMIWRWLRCFHLSFVSSPHIIHVFSTASWRSPFGRPVSITGLIQSRENAWFISSNRFSHCLRHFLNKQHYIFQLVKLNNGELSQNIDAFLPLISNYQYIPRAPCAEIQVFPCSAHHVCPSHCDCFLTSLALLQGHLLMAAKLRILDMSCHFIA